MSKTNCVNCGAAKDTSEIKCPFCGTTYLDLTAIDFASGDPVVCEFVLPTSVRLGDSEGRVVMSSGFDRMYSFIDSYDVNVGVSFRPIITQHRGNTLFTLRALEE